MSEDRRVKSSGPTAIALCEALGLNPRLTTSIKLDCTVGKLMSVKVEQYLTEEQAFRIGSIVTEYNLIPKSGIKDVTAIADTARVFSVVTPPIGQA